MVFQRTACVRFVSSTTDSRVKRCQTRFGECRAASRCSLHTASQTFAVCQRVIEQAVSVRTTGTD